MNYDGNYRLSTIETINHLLIFKFYDKYYGIEMVVLARLYSKYVCRISSSVAVIK